MKLIAIGDIHGRDQWKLIVEQAKWDICVFVGDYFDSFDIDAETQIKNFEAIVRFKVKSNKIVVLLMGNHDLHYLVDNERYSGYQDNPRIRQALKTASPHLTKICMFDQLLFSHAGLTKTWVTSRGIDQKNIVNEVNSLPLDAFKFIRSEGFDDSGNNKEQGCMWVRPQSLREDFWGSTTQVIGHTQVGSMVSVENKFILIDALQAGQYLYQDDNGCFIKNIEYGTTITD